MNQKLKALIAGIGIFVSILISGCLEEPQQNGDSVNISSYAPFFPVQKNPTDECMDAELSDKPEELVLEDGCLRAGGYLLIWPYNFSLSTKDGVIHVIDDTGQPIARVGDKLTMGGGESPYEYDRCPCPCWVVCKYGITSD